MLVPHLFVAVQCGRLDVAVGFDEGQINLIPKLNHPHRAFVLHPNVYLLAHEVITQFFGVGFRLVIVAEPVRFLLAGAVRRDIIADMPSAETLREMTLLVSAHGCSLTNFMDFTKSGMEWDGTKVLVLLSC